MGMPRTSKAEVSGDALNEPLTRQQKAERDFLNDPMPHLVEPCLALLASEPPTCDGWSYEVKWDGYRLSLHIADNQVRIITRGGQDWTGRFPAIAQAGLGLDVDYAIIDGEAVVLDERGAANFSALQKALGGRAGKCFAYEAILYAFDLLYLNGHDLRDLGCAERRAILDDLLSSKPQGALRMSQDFQGDGRVFFKRACEVGLEGIIAKRQRAPYRSGRGGEWLKIKCIQTESFVIIGYEPSTAALGGIGRLALAARKGDHLVYIGGVGTGFAHAGATALRKQMDAAIIPKPAVPMMGRRYSYRWLAPTLVAEIAFSGWTDDGKLHQPSYKGLREDADEASVFEIGE